MTKKLRTGFTTGTAAAAATKGALSFILQKAAPKKVDIMLLTGDPIRISIHRSQLEDATTATCTVIKDAGDDPDVTHKAEIGARVSLLPANSMAQKDNIKIVITGGEGVGQVTKPGLEVQPGQAAINPGPRKMITQAIESLVAGRPFKGTIATEIFVPQGRKLALKTLNARLGILGGISILGTTGIVKPMSHDAFMATIESALSVARASGLTSVVLTTGRRSERFSQAYLADLPEEAFIQIGDFFKISLESAAKKGFTKITLAVFFGKALKMAQGIPHTHAAKAGLTLNVLSEWVDDVTADSLFAKTISSANTARQAFGLIKEAYPQVVDHVGNKIVQAAGIFAGPNIDIENLIFDYDGEVVFDSAAAGIIGP
jgi:cobalt-precorrin-5B (C1)-methyltransferase